MDETAKVEANLKDLLEVMVNRSEKEVDAVMPGYTHLQVSYTLPLHRQSADLLVPHLVMKTPA